MTTANCSNVADDVFLLHQRVPSMPSFSSSRENIYGGGGVKTVFKQSSTLVVLHFKCNTDYEKVVCSLHLLVLNMIACSYSRPPAGQSKKFLTELRAFFDSVFSETLVC